MMIISSTCAMMKMKRKGRGGIRMSRARTSRMAMETTLLAKNIGPLNIVNQVMLFKTRYHEYSMKN